MAKNKAATKQDAKPVEAADDAQELSAKGEPIDPTKVYTFHQFRVALGIKDGRTVDKYGAAGLLIRKVVGTSEKFIRGIDWFEFLGRSENVAKSLDDSKQPASEGIAAKVEHLNGQVEELGGFMEYVGELNLEEIKSNVQLLKFVYDYPHRDPYDREG
jgi:hypothetical protein